MLERIFTQIAKLGMVTREILTFPFHFPSSLCRRDGEHWNVQGAHRQTRKPFRDRSRQVSLEKIDT